MNNDNDKEIYCIEKLVRMIYDCQKHRMPADLIAPLTRLFETSLPREFSIYEVNEAFIDFIRRNHDMPMPLDIIEIVFVNRYKKMNAG